MVISCELLHSQFIYWKGIRSYLISDFAYIRTPNRCFLPSIWSSSRLPKQLLLFDFVSSNCRDYSSCDSCCSFGFGPSDSWIGSCIMCCIDYLCGLLEAGFKSFKVDCHSQYQFFEMHSLKCQLSRLESLSRYCRQWCFLYCRQRFDRYYWMSL